MVGETRLWRLIEQWRAGQTFPPSQAAIARAIGVAPTALSQWKLGQSQPKPEHLRRLATVTGIDYHLLLAAMNTDAGYLRDDELTRGGQWDAGQAEAAKSAGDEGGGAPVKPIQPAGPSGGSYDLDQAAITGGRGKSPGQRAREHADRLEEDNQDTDPDHIA